VIVDAHTHIWSRWPYEPGVPDPTSRGSFEALLFEMDANGVDQALLVSAQIAGAGDNNDYGAAAVRAHPGRFLHLVDADSRWSPDYHQAGAARRLEELVARYRPVGISHYLGATDDGWLGSSAAAEYFAVASKYKLVVSLAAPPRWFASVRQLARAFPEIPVLVNHLAVVATHPGGIEPAMALVLDDEDIPNLLVKVSGLYYGNPRPWDYPYDERFSIVRRFYEHWGPMRMVWASDFPSLLPHLSYRQALELLREHAPFIAPLEQAAILGETLSSMLRDRATARR